MRKTPSLWIRVPLYVFIIVAMLVVNLPFIWMVVTSFKTEDEVFTLPPKFYPNFYDFRNYQGAMAQIPMGWYLLNSLFVALAVTLIQLAFNSFAAYGLSRLRFRGRNLIFFILIGTLMVPPEVTFVPLYMIVNKLGFLNSYRALIVPFMSSAFGIFLLRQFFLGIPRELEEAAIMDGAGRLKIFFKIILPLSKPALWTMSLYTFIAYWNEYMWPLVAVSDPKYQMIQVGISQFVSGWETRWTYRMAASTLTVIPIIIFFFFVQRQFVEGISISGIKE